MQILRYFFHLSITSCLFLAACTKIPGTDLIIPSNTLIPISSSRPTSTTIPTFTPSPTATFPPSATLVSTREVCSPLEGVQLADLAERVVNPYLPPAIGSDQPHQGIDMADPGKGEVAHAGLGVHAVLPGKVAMVVIDRFPYGNALLIETSLQDTPAEWLNSLHVPEPIPTLSFIPSLTCPQPENPPDWTLEKRSLYLLYAHLENGPLFEVDQEISCGEKLGSIGDSGNALNPHLHLEARIGPSGIRFNSLAHYDPSASQEEMENYCIWRVSGWFQHFDPSRLFNSGN